MERLEKAVLKGKNILPHICRLRNEGAIIIISEPADPLDTYYKVSVKMNDRYLTVFSRQLFKELQDENN